MFKRTWQQLFLFVLISGGLLMACQTHSGESPSPTLEQIEAPAQTVISFACSDSERAAYESLAQGFYKINPDIQVEIISLDSLLEGDLPEGAVAAIAAAADTAAFPFSPSDTRRGLIHDLAPFIGASSSFHAEDFYPQTLDAFRWDDGTWAVPTSLSFIFLYYDRDAFDAAGVPYPQQGWTWDEFRQVAQELTQREGDEITRYGFVGLAYGTAAYVAQAQAGSLWDATVGRPVPGLTQPDVVAAVEWYVDLALKDGVMPSTTERRALNDLVAAGQAAVWTGHVTDFVRYGEGRNLSIVSLPGEGIPMLVGGYWMSAGTAHPQAGWRWLDYLTRHTGKDREPYYWPARRSTATRGEHRETLAARFGEEMAVAYESGLRTGRLAPDRTVRKALEEAVISVMLDEQSSPEALAVAQARLLGELAQTAAPEETPVAVNTPSLSEGRPVVFIAQNNPDVYRSLAQEFNRSHPDLQVQIRHPFKPGSYDMSRVAGLGDCFTWEGTGKTFVYAVEHGDILSLQPFVEADDSAHPNEIYPVLVDLLTWGGELWGLPFDVRPLVIYWNPRVFERMGIAEPSPNWDLETFLETAVSLTEGQEDEKTYGFVNYNVDILDFLFFILQYGAEPFDVSGEQWWPAFDAPTTVKAVQWYAGLRLSYGTTPPLVFDTEWGVAEKDWLVRQRSILAGRAGMWTSALENPTMVYQTVYGDLPVKVAPLPTGPGRRQDGYVQAFYISSQAEYPADCWEWLVFLSHRPEIVRGLSARKTLPASETLEEQVGQKAIEALYDSLEDAEFFGMPEFYSAVYLEVAPSVDWLYGAYVSTLEGVEAATALAQAQSTAEVYFGCLAEAGKDPGQEQIKACLLEADPEYQLPHYLR